MKLYNATSPTIESPPRPKPAIPRDNYLAWRLAVLPVPSNVLADELVARLQGKRKRAVGKRELDNLRAALDKITADQG